MALGRKTGGRTKGTPNRRTVAHRELAAQLATTTGASPLEVLLACMRHAFARGEAELAADFAAKAAPYVHPKLSAIELDLKDLSDEDLRAAAR